MHTRGLIHSPGKAMARLPLTQLELEPGLGPMYLCKGKPRLISSEKIAIQIQKSTILALQAPCLTLSQAMDFIIISLDHKSLNNIQMNRLTYQFDPYPQCHVSNLATEPCIRFDLLKEVSINKLAFANSSCTAGAMIVIVSLFHSDQE